MNFYAVITTIQPPTPCVVELNHRLAEWGGRLVVAGDKRGPSRFDLPDCEFLSLDDQQSGDYSLANGLPVGHYARKNIGYLYAMREGAECIYETDDDNAPRPNWRPRSLTVSDARRIDATGWINVYRYFTNDPHIWPRGFPLDYVQSSLSTVQPFSVSASPLISPIQQGLVNGSPDVDAVWRLTQDRHVDFDQESPLYLGEGQWCPFNTQSAWWWPEAYPLMYVPSFCSFRMCDIWKSFIAQRCLWAMGYGVTFHAPEVIQERNEHNLMKDFEDEAPGYLRNHRIAEMLQGLKLAAGEDAVGDNLHRCYEALIAGKIFPAKEMALVEAWLGDNSRMLPRFSVVASDLSALPERPLVSIVVPSYNQGAFIRQTIDSCLQQNYRPIEILVTDGASTDDTVEVLKSYGEAPELKWVSEPDSGVVDAVNKGFARARGDVVAIQSSDDYYLPGAIKLAVAAFREHHEAALIYGNVQTVNPKGVVLGVSDVGPFSLEGFLAKETVMLQPAVFFRRSVLEALGGWRDTFFVADTEFWLRAVFRFNAHVVPHVFSARCIHLEQRNNRWEQIVHDYHRMILESEELRVAPLRLCRAAMAGRYLNELKYRPSVHGTRRIICAWAAAMARPSLLFRGALVGECFPGYYTLRRGGSRLKQRWIKQVRCE